MRNKLNQTIFFLFFILMLIPVAYGTTRTEKTITGVLFNETFNYSDSNKAYGQSDWQISQGGCGNFPVLSPSNAFGVNQTYQCGFGFTGLLKQDMNTTGCNGYDPQLCNISNNTRTIISFDFYTEGLATPSLGFRRGTELGDVLFSITINNGNQVSTFGHAVWVGFEACSYTGDFTDGEYHEVTVDFDTNVNEYDVYVDGFPVCVGNAIGTITQDLQGIQPSITFNAGYNSTDLIDNILVAEGYVSGSVQECAFPTVFCDNFNYDIPLMSANDWTVYNEDNSVDTTFNPYLSEAVFNNSVPKTLFHAVEPFEMGWEIAEGVTVNSGVYASQFSQEFVMNISEGNVELLTSDFRFSREVYHLNISVNASTWIDISYRLPDGSWEYVCTSCTTLNNDHTYKITSNFAQREKMPFNTSFLNDSVVLYIDSAEVGRIIGFIEPDTQNQNKHNIIVESKTTIDDYFVYVGTDKTTNTLDSTQTNPLVEDTNQTFTVGDSGTEDFFDVVTNLWVDFGLKTVASRVLFGMLMLVIIAAFTIGLMFSSGFFSFPALLVILGLVTIVEIFIQLIPIWVFGVGAVVGIGIAVLSIKFLSQ